MKKIFIVEDNELNLKLFHDLLVAHGYQVESTSDGAVAYELACQSNPDLIIMDIQLNGISGVEIIKMMRNDPRLQTVPIIAVTAFSLKKDEEPIIRSGCNAYVQKPISIISFIETVRRYIGEGVDR